jgi:hypothetical protein
MRSIDELIAKKSSNNGQGMEDAAGNLYSPGDTGEVAALRKRKQLLKETMDIEVQANREAARAAKETERSYTYGRDTLFVQYVDAATNSAQQAREVWAASLQGMSQNLTQMIVKGKADWRSFGEQIVSMLIEIQIRRQIAGVMGLFMPTQGGGAGGPYGSSPVSPMDVPLFRTEPHRRYRRSRGQRVLRRSPGRLLGRAALPYRRLGGRRDADHREEGRRRLHARADARDGAGCRRRHERACRAREPRHAATGELGRAAL